MKDYTHRGQAALEFMMTYGWAILVVLAAIGALSYFGILNPAKFTPDTCLASSGFACPGKPIVTDGSVAFSIVNGLGYKVTLNQTLSNGAALVLSSTLTNAGCVIGNVHFCTQGITNCSNTGIVIEDGAGATINVSSCNFAQANVVKGEIQFPYINPQSKLTETMIISVTGKSKS